MNITEFFESLGAPLHNVRRSWGSVRKSDKTVILRVWRDRVIEHNGRSYVCILNRSKHRRAGDFYYLERLDHIRRIKAGAPCLLVFCVAVDCDAQSRTIASFDSVPVVGRDVIAIGDDLYIGFDC